MSLILLFYSSYLMVYEELTEKAEPHFWHRQWQSRGNPWKNTITIHSDAPGARWAECKKMVTTEETDKCRYKYGERVCLLVQSLQNGRQWHSNNLEIGFYSFKAESFWSMKNRVFLCLRMFCQILLVLNNILPYFIVSYHLISYNSTLSLVALYGGAIPGQL